MFSSLNQSVSQTLRSLSFLEPGWDGYNATSFSAPQLKQCRQICDALGGKPMINPTGYGAIQIEFHFIFGQYLEFEVYPEFVRFFMIHDDGSEETAILKPEEMRLLLGKLSGSSRQEAQ